MKIRKSPLLMVLTAGMAALIGLLLVQRQASHEGAARASKTLHEADSRAAADQALPAPLQIPPASPETQVREEISADPAPAIQPVPDSHPIAPTQQVAQANARAKAPKRSKPPIKDPIARTALSLVGADPEAEAYWYGAINDATLSEGERKDLIEDLNEDGLTDPRHPSLEDVPLIVSRLALIEDLAPDAMDKVNAEAFAEAYKDLVKMLETLGR